jgi:hypothetical protein
VHHAEESFSWPTQKDSSGTFGLPVPLDQGTSHNILHVFVGRRVERSTSRSHHSNTTSKGLSGLGKDIGLNDLALVLIVHNRVDRGLDSFDDAVVESGD